MGKVYVKDGTPMGSTSLCRTCRWAHIMTGYRESEMAVFCTEVSPNFAVPFKVNTCTGYLDRNRPDWDQMEKLAIDVLPASSAKALGFRAKKSVAAEEDECVTSRERDSITK
jgi:hypothetical protein